MKRLGQLFLSLIFVLTVSTIYFAFDLAVTSMHKPKKYSLERHEAHRVQSSTTTSTISSLISIKTLERNLENKQAIADQTGRTHHVKRKHPPGKSAQFHKSRTGVKINAKGQRKFPPRIENNFKIHQPTV